MNCTPNLTKTQQLTARNIAWCFGDSGRTLAQTVDEIRRYLRRDVPPEMTPTLRRQWEAGRAAR